MSTSKNLPEGDALTDLPPGVMRDRLLSSEWDDVGLRIERGVTRKIKKFDRKKIGISRGDALALGLAALRHHRQIVVLRVGYMDCEERGQHGRVDLLKR
jgi:hypothetical protein